VGGGGRKSNTMSIKENKNKIFLPRIQFHSIHDKRSSWEIEEVKNFVNGRKEEEKNNSTFRKIG
jgi:hypothetical protein